MIGALTVSFIELGWRMYSCQDFTHIGDILVGNALSPPIAAFQSIQKRLPHRAGDFGSRLPIRSSFETDFKMPLPGKLCRQNESPLSRRGIGVGPLDFQDRIPLLDWYNPA